MHWFKNSGKHHTPVICKETPYVWHAMLSQCIIPATGISSKSISSFWIGCVYWKMMENAWWCLRFLPENPTTIYEYPSVGTTPATSLRSPPCNLALHLSNEILRLPQREVVEAMHLATPLKATKWFRFLQKDTEKSWRKWRNFNVITNNDKSW